MYVTDEKITDVRKTLDRDRRATHPQIIIRSQPWKYVLATGKKKIIASYAVKELKSNT